MLAILLPAALALSGPALAQESAGQESTGQQSAAVPWLYRGSDVPQDRAWQFGELPNGVRYAVRHNGVPPGQVALRVVIDAGSLYETDAERGYAHLLEHLVFRQSKYLADGEAIPAWQRLGATFGSDTNAQTGFTQTTFKIDLPGATPEKLDQGLRLLSGMLISPTLSEANLKADVPIVLAEMRDHLGPETRVIEGTLGTLYAGQPLSRRLPIGTAETLNAATAESVRAFHRRWYRPERAVVVAVGDADPAALAALVTKYFGGWKVPGKAAPSPSFGDPVAPAGSDPANPVSEPPVGETHVGETSVLVEPDLPREVTYAVLRPWRPVNDTVAYNQGLMIDALAEAIINDRLERRARTGGSYLTARIGQEDVSRSADVTQVSVQPIGADWGKALGDVRALIADALAQPPAQEEIDKALADMETGYQVFVEQRALLPGARLADDMVQAFDIRETIASPETVLDIFEATKPMFTPEAVLEHTRKLFAGTVTRAFAIVPNQGEADAAGLRLALTRPVTPDASARLATASISFASLPPIGPAGKPPVLRDIGLLDIGEADFGNGVKALLYPTTSEPGRVSVKVRFGRGYRAFVPAEAPYVALGDRALVAPGEATPGAEEIDRISPGRKLGFDFSIEDASFPFFAETRQSDLEDQLYLFAAKFALPRWDANPVERAKAAQRLEYDAYATSPQGMLARDLAFYSWGRDPRYRTPTPDETAATTPEGFRKVWERVLAQGPIEIQIYGDIDRAATLAALQKTFGALPPRSALAPDPVAAAGNPAPPSPIVLAHRGDVNQAAAVLTWQTGGGAVELRESRQLYILGEVFQNRLLEAIRQKMGASYSPIVETDWPLDLPSGGTFRAIAQVKPADVPLFYATARQIAADLIARPPSADELERVTEPLRQTITRAMTGSGLFMAQIEGATEDPRRFAWARTMLPDYTETTPQTMQALAQRYLDPAKGWELSVVPAAGSAVAVTSGGR